MERREEGRGKEEEQERGGEERLGPKESESTSCYGAAHCAGLRGFHTQPSKSIVTFT